MTRHFALRAYIDMYGVDPFETDVGAYPSVTLIERGTSAVVRTATATSTDAHYLSELARDLSRGSGLVRIVPAPVAGEGPWLLRGDAREDIVRELEVRLPTLEVGGCRVGIGVATGADKVFVGQYNDLPVEESRKLPLAVNKDLVKGQLSWHGMGVINPWNDDGGLVDLGDFPRLAAYLRPHRELLERRHTAKANPESRWYKTIDRITPSLTWQPKLLVPDIRGDGDAIAFDAGAVYPHHNLYHITSTVWDLRALQVLLRSGLARLFVDAYAVRIGGGYVRFQAQYLRRIRVPSWDGLDAGARQVLSDAAETGEKLTPVQLEAICGLKLGSLGFMEEWS
ncbi:MAG: hypothetical protein FWF36_10260 [Propionibacteriaceae bacterium]|nr:hypothetical protein [Propionibacteriaceae bacterium]